MIKLRKLVSTSTMLKLYKAFAVCRIFYIVLQNGTFVALGIIATNVSHYIEQARTACSF